MSVYPMEGAKASLVHKGRTKEYFLTLIINALGQSILIKRWGAVGATGQVKVEKYPTREAGEKAYQKNLDERQSNSKSYIIKDSKVIKMETAEALPLAVGRTVFPKIGGSNVQHIDPNYDVTGMREPEANRDEDGNFVGDKQRKVQIDPDVLAAAEKAEREAELAPMMSNPNFGRF